MDFEWDEDKRTSTFEGRGVDFAQMTEMFAAPIIEWPDTRKSYGEERFIALGVYQGRVHVVVYTIRNGKRRIISARKANNREQEIYWRALAR